MTFIKIDLGHFRTKSKRIIRAVKIFHKVVKSLHSLRTMCALFALGGFIMFFFKYYNFFFRYSRKKSSKIFLMIIWKKMIETQSYILFYVNGKRILGRLLNSCPKHSIRLTIGDGCKNWLFKELKKTKMLTQKKRYCTILGRFSNWCFESKNVSHWGRPRYVFGFENPFRNPLKEKHYISLGVSSVVVKVGVEHVQ